MRATELLSTSASFLIIALSTVCFAQEAEVIQTDPLTGLFKDAEENWIQVRNNCVACHSARMLTQQQHSKDQWLQAIRRMQAKEKLWDLGQAEERILDYLSTYYGDTGDKEGQRKRRAPLSQPPLPVEDS